DLDLVEGPLELVLVPGIGEDHDAVDHQLRILQQEKGDEDHRKQGYGSRPEDPEEVIEVGGQGGYIKGPEEIRLPHAFNDVDLLHAQISVNLVIQLIQIPVKGVDIYLPQVLALLNDDGDKDGDQAHDDAQNQQQYCHHRDLVGNVQSLPKKDHGGPSDKGNYCGNGDIHQHRLDLVQEVQQQTHPQQN